MDVLLTKKLSQRFQNSIKLKQSKGTMKLNKTFLLILGLVFVLSSTIINAALTTPTDHRLLRRKQDQSAKRDTPPSSEASSREHQVAIEAAEMKILQDAKNSIEELEGLEPMTTTSAVGGGGSRSLSNYDNCQTAGCIACTITCDLTFGRVENTCIAGCWGAVCLWKGKKACKRCTDKCKEPRWQCYRTCQNL